MEQPAEGSADLESRSDVAMIGDVPHSDEAQVGIEPGILGHFAVRSFRNAARAEILMKMVGRRQKDFAAVDLALPGLIFDARPGTFEGGTRSHVPIIGPIQDQGVARAAYAQDIVR